MKEKIKELMQEAASTNNRMMHFIKKVMSEPKEVEEALQGERVFKIIPIGVHIEAYDSEMQSSLNVYYHVINWENYLHLYETKIKEELKGLLESYDLADIFKNHIYAYFTYHTADGLIRYIENMDISEEDYVYFNGKTFGTLNFPDVLRESEDHERGITWINKIQSYLNKEIGKIVFAGDTYSARIVDIFCQVPRDNIKSLRIRIAYVGSIAAITEYREELKSYFHPDYCTLFDIEIEKELKEWKEVQARKEVYYRGLINPTNYEPVDDQEMMKNILIYFYK
jgi:hypothetical protein